MRLAAEDRALGTLETLVFDNQFTKDLPADPKKLNRLREVHGAFYSWVEPTPSAGEPHTVIASPQVARLIGLDPMELDRPEFAKIFSGNEPLPGVEPYAQCYGGHQFGVWAGQLGDGRAICLGEVVDGAGEHWELQLKGAGKTPYSRMADGRAVMRSSVREYVASEAMAALGVPTTRALSLVSTGDLIYRDMFYDGNHREEPGAVVCRVARSFVRFGTFQLPCARGDEHLSLVRTLADHVLNRHMHEILLDNEEEENVATLDKDDTQEEVNRTRYSSFLLAVARRTAETVVHWHRVGFVHGVLNTDNMSILGDTIDYGPFAFMERFDPGFTPNTTDLPGRRYAFKNQPGICQFNLLMLGKAFVMAGLLTTTDLQQVLDEYAETLGTEFQNTMRRKLGLKEFDEGLYAGLTSLMIEDKADYTNTWRALREISADDEPTAGLPPRLLDALREEGEELKAERLAEWEAWADQYRVALRGQNVGPKEQKTTMDAVNPAIIPRNHVLVDIIKRVEDGDAKVLTAYMKALERPYEENSEIDAAWIKPGPKEVRKGIELLSCSS